MFKNNNAQKIIHIGLGNNVINCDCETFTKVKVRRLLRTKYKLNNYELCSSQFWKIFFKKTLIISQPTLIAQEKIIKDWKSISCRSPNVSVRGSSTNLICDPAYIVGRITPIRLGFVE